MTGMKQPEHISLAKVVKEDKEKCHKKTSAKEEIQRNFRRGNSKRARGKENKQLQEKLTNVFNSTAAPSHHFLCICDVRS